MGLFFVCLSVLTTGDGLMKLELEILQAGFFDDGKEERDIGFRLVKAVGPEVEIKNNKICTF